jgi:hypothetical protein
MPPSIVVLIREDPEKTHRAVEALRIALGLGTGENPLTVVLLGRAPLLLSEDPSGLVDAEVLERHLPVFKEWKTLFILQIGSRSRFAVDGGFSTREASMKEIASLIHGADRVLAF